MDKTGVKLLNFWYPTLHHVPTHPTHIPTIFVVLSAGQEDRDFSKRFKMAAKQLSGALRTYIAAGKATPSPPLGPSLGQVENYFLLYLFHFILFYFFKS